MQTINCPDCQATVQGDAEGIAAHVANHRPKAVIEIPPAPDPRDARIEHLRTELLQLSETNAALNKELAAADATVMTQAAKIAELTSQPTAPGPSGEQAQSA